MTFINTGTITASKPLDEEARDMIVEILGEPCDWFEIRADSLVFMGFPSGSLDDAIDNIVDLLGSLGIQLEGRIDYEGSYEGAYLWKMGEKHTELDQDEVAIMDAGDQTLINELKKRGYNVQDIRQSRHQTLNGIDEQNKDIAEAIFELPHTKAEGNWLYEHLTTLSAKESIALAAATMGGPPKTATDAINLLQELKNYTVCFAASNYEALGMHYLNCAHITLPESALEHTDLYGLGIKYQDAHPGLFLDDCYVMYPESAPEQPYDGYNPLTLRWDDWSVKVRLTSEQKPDGVWIRLPDYSDTGSITKLEEVEAALHELGARLLEDCTIAEAKCILPEAGDLMEQYTDAEKLISDGNDLGAMLDIGGGLKQIRAKLSASQTEFGTLHEVLGTLNRFDFITEDELKDFARGELQMCGMPDELIGDDVVDLRGFAKDLLDEQGYRLDRESGVYIRPKEAEQELAMDTPQLQM